MLRELELDKRENTSLCVACVNVCGFQIDTKSKLQAHKPVCSGGTISPVSYEEEGWL